jgi:tetratricopeptide (TPR) repeat protein
MRWAVILCLIVGVGADASARQVKESSADLSRRPVRQSPSEGGSVGAEAEAKAAFERGRAAHNAGKRDEAVSSFERAVALDPTSSLYQMWLGHAYSRQLSSAGFLRKPFIGRRSGEAYNMAVKLDPTSIDAAEARLVFFLDAPGIVGGGVDKARAEAARIATLDAYRGAMAEARIAEHEKDRTQAERLYRSLMAEYPDRTAAVDALVTILQNDKRFDEAFTIVDDRLARLPDESSSLYNLGRLSAVSGQHLARGEAAMRRFLTLTTADSVRQSNAHYRLGIIKEKMGDAPAAATEYRAALDLYPRHEPAAAALKRIQRQ